MGGTSSANGHGFHMHEGVASPPCGHGFDLHMGVASPAMWERTGMKVNFYHVGADLPMQFRILAQFAHKNVLVPHYVFWSSPNKGGA